MSILRQTEIDRMRLTAETALDKVCTIERVSIVSDGMGGTTQTWTTLVTNVPCAIAPRGGTGEEDEDAVVRGRASLILTLHHDQDIEADDRVVIEGKQFEVLAVHFRSYQVTKRVELAEVT